MNGSDDNIYWPNSYASVIDMMLYLASNTRPDISFAVHQCARFTHNTKASHKTSVERICRYLQCTKDNDLVFNTYKKLMVDCYADAGFLDCGDINILKTLFVLELELDLW